VRPGTFRALAWLVGGVSVALSLVFLIPATSLVAGAALFVVGVLVLGAGEAGHDLMRRRAWFRSEFGAYENFRARAGEGVDVDTLRELKRRKGQLAALRYLVKAYPLLPRDTASLFIRDL
jgi:hypothetical protein